MAKGRGATGGGSSQRTRAGHTRATRRERGYGPPHKGPHIPAEEGDPLTYGNWPSTRKHSRKSPVRTHFGGGPVA